MISVRLIIPACPDWATRTLIAQLLKGGGDAFAAHAVRLAGAGVVEAARLAAQLRRAPSVDVTHSFGQTALTAALACGGGKIVYMPVRTATAARARWLRAVRHYRRLTIICPTDQSRRALVGRGLPPDDCVLIRPGVDYARVSGRRDEVLRTALGLSDDDRALLTAGEAAPGAGHEPAILAAALLRLVDRRYRALCWDRGPRAAAVRRFGRRMGQEGLIIPAQKALGRSVEFDDLLPAADAVVCASQDGSQTLALCTALAAGVPIVAVASPATAEVLEDRHNALLVKDGRPQALARRIGDAFEDQARTEAIRQQGRGDAYEYFSLTRMLEAYRTLYANVAADKTAESEASAVQPLEASAR
jgi:glycosyltransferase involved in cell wall biosynthesis